ncbi:MAG: rhomboid family intramembrane serine protease [Myxococcota bacterium]|nr:rhomboid family intramembrane serine protease [Myxococcales bacterium]
MFPVRDENPTAHRPIATIALIALNAWTWAALQGLGSEATLVQSICTFGLIPAELLGTVGAGAVLPLGPEHACVADGRAAATVVTSMFMHGGWAHILGNLWFLWIFGDNVEDAMGPVRFVAFYVLCGLVAAVTQVASHPASLVPMVGASGAIGGVMGAYIRLFPRARIHMLLVLGFYVTTAAVPAVWMLGYWFLVQLLGGLPQLAGFEGGVAFWAHVGGFVAGALLVGVFRSEGRMRARLALTARRTARYRI